MLSTLDSHCACRRLRALLGTSHPRHCPDDFCCSKEKQHPCQVMLGIQSSAGVSEHDSSGSCTCLHPTALGPRSAMLYCVSQREPHSGGFEHSLVTWQHGPGYGFSICLELVVASLPFLGRPMGPGGEDVGAPGTGLMIYTQPYTDCKEVC